jgi:predicted metalloprotease
VVLPVTAGDMAGEQTGADQLVALSLNNLDAFWAAAYAARGRAWRPLADPLAVRRNATATVTCGGAPVDPADVARGAWLCAAEGNVGVNVAGIGAVAGSLGDFAAVLVLSVPWARVAAAGLGGDADCLAGAWAGDRPDGDEGGRAAPLALSGTDLDEAVAGLLATSTAGGSDGERTAFDRVEAFRRGYEGGLGACLAGGGG